jgi:cytohesin
MALSLHEAAQQGQRERVQQLLAAGADVDEEGQGHSTPLYIAAENGHYQVVLLLLDAGASVTAADASSDSGASQDAADSDSKSGGDVNATMPSHSRRKDWTLMHAAVDGGHPGVVQLLLAAGADADAEATECMGEGWTPLYLAARNGDHEIVQLLLAAGARYDIRPACGFSPLHEAPELGHLKVVQLLLAAGAPVNPATPAEISDYWETPLYAASCQQCWTRHS